MLLCIWGVLTRLVFHVIEKNLNSENFAFSVIPAEFLARNITYATNGWRLPLSVFGGLFGFLFVYREQRPVCELQFCNHLKWKQKLNYIYISSSSSQMRMIKSLAHVSI